MASRPHCRVNPLSPRSAAHLKTAVVIPTYNEKESLPRLMRAVLELPVNIEIVVVDDNSPDGTGAIADDYAANHAQVRVVHRSGKLGLGTAYVAGFRQALAGGADRVVTMDADFSHNPRYIPNLVALCERYDLAIGSRYVAGGGIDANWGFHRKLLSAAANRFARTMLGLRAHDCTAGFRCYRAAVLRRIPLDDIRSNGYSFLVEMLYLCQSRGCTIGETPILFEDRREGISKISQVEIVKGVRTVVRLGVRRFGSL
jgi:dolichol-phosphate mannosyltransferase